MDTPVNQQEKSEAQKKTFARIAERVGKVIDEEWTEIGKGEKQAEVWMAKRFNELKSKFLHTLDLLDKEVHGWKEDANGEVKEIKSRLLSMRKLVSVAAAETTHVVHTQQEQITEAWMDLRKRIEARPEYHQFRESMKEEWMDWKIRFDLLKVRTHLAGMEAEDALNKFRKRYEKEKNTIRHSIEEGAGIVQEKLESFEAEMSKIIEKVRQGN
ncbi:MAG: hypothetical protein LW707_04745 [Sphingobacteriales bacterium]|jgi:hypothetical protein|nr:hypothetical protein [Sphingobacteriales bacterium]